MGIFSNALLYLFLGLAGEHLMLLKAKDEQPVWGPAQEGYLPQRASALVPRVSLEEQVSLNSCQETQPLLCCPKKTTQQLLH